MQGPPAIKTHNTHALPYEHVTFQGPLRCHGIMVSPLKDDERAKKLLHLVHGWLSKDLQLPLPSAWQSKKGRIYTFGAFLGVLRASSPLFRHPKAFGDLQVPCPLARRFPTTHTGMLVHYEDVHVALAEIIDNGVEMNRHKMWRLLVWIFLGNGGQGHVAWHELKNSWSTSTWRDDEGQPLSILRFVSTAVCRLGGVMKVIGSDGLDKKFRLSKPAFLQLREWHKRVPSLVEAFNESPEAFREELGSVRGLRGALTQKEVLILLGASKYAQCKKVGQSLLPFGQGAKNGALVFLGIPLKTGKDSGFYYKRKLSEYCGQLEEVVDELFPSLPSKMRRVTLGDIEPCLCGAFIYAKQIEQLRDTLPSRWTWSDECWEKIENLPVPAGFRPHTRDGVPEISSTRTRSVMRRCRKRTSIIHGRLDRCRLLRAWGLKLPVRKVEKKQSFSSSMSSLFCTCSPFLLLFASFCIFSFKSFNHLFTTFELIIIIEKSPTKLILSNLDTKIGALNL